jgi:small-conductance mechanosensitive channel
MNNYTDWTSTLRDAFLGLGHQVIDYLPSLLAAIGLLIVGGLLGKLLRAAAVRLARMLEQMMLRLSRRPPPARPGRTPPWGRLLGSIVFWAVVLFFLALATHVLGLEAFSSWLNRVVVYLPTLLVGVLIILAGILVSALTRDLVIATAPVAESQRVLLGRVVQVVILVTAIVIGADQIGINVTFLVILAAVVLSTLLGGLALAVSLGARTFVANLVAAQSLRNSYQVGQLIRIATYEGRILELTPTAVIIETAEGRVSLPAKFFNEQPAVLLMGRDA